MPATGTNGGGAVRRIVIIGSGLAGYGVARELRKLDREARITLVTRDAGDFYAKPSLSNALAAARAADALVTTPAGTICAQLDLTLMAHTTVEGIDRQAREVLTSGGRLPYTGLVLATGADPVRLPIAGDGAGAVLQVNDLDDYRRFREAIAGASRIAILGAGLIGSEFANDLLATGLRVGVIDPAPRPLAALLPEPAGRWFASRLAAAGVEWRFGDAVDSVAEADRGSVLSLRGGARLEADAVLCAVGLRPRTTLASAAGLRVERGIVVDEYAATSDPAILAIGDCAQYGARLLPYVQPIMTAARAIAATLAGTPTPVRFGPMPVIVKTPACPAVILPPSDDGGEWLASSDGDGMEMRYVDADERLRGFVLLGSAASRRAELLRQVAAPQGIAAA